MSQNIYMGKRGAESEWLDTFLICIFIDFGFLDGKTSNLFVLSNGVA